MGLVFRYELLLAHRHANLRINSFMLVWYWFLEDLDRPGCVCCTYKLTDVSRLTSNRMTNAKRTAEISQNCGVKL